MATICRFLKQLESNIFRPGLTRSISLSATSRIKEIIERKEGNDLIIEAVIKPDKYEGQLLKPKNGACTVCSSGLDIKHTDVLILSQFVKPNGGMLPRRITGLCKVQHKRIGVLVAMAQRSGIMPSLEPSKFDLKRRYKLTRFNTYYDEKTIQYRYK